MKNKTKKIVKYILLSFLLVLIITGLWIFRPPTPYDRSKVDKRLTSLEEPFKEVLVLYYEDGGSVAINIIDKNDTFLKIALPVIEFNRSYDKIYFGVNHHSELKECHDATAENHQQTKLMIEDILCRYSSMYADLALFAIRRRCADGIRFFYKHLMGSYDEKNNDSQRDGR